ncbi:FAD/NAD(P)-binding domain-containing protein [Byssothecium circinans]|uniref:FAD/NAD(P)-binding domain-containing protein n=1 Tax=Byssothecium circinans TaxID=147558 RepID=A0A6A5TCW2_9PLEO|nr:FAD/NAD(P)-binding domain-containing protein [Byssothecium circinans]
MASPKLEVVIVGGSLAGLMHGVMLRSLGHNVHILEQADDVRESHMVGVCCAADSLEFLQRFDRLSTDFTMKSERLQFLKQSGLLSHYFKAPRLITSRDALYWRLRANFDGYASDYYPDPPPVQYEGSGQGVVWAQTKVTSVDLQGDKVVVSFQKEGDSVQHRTADLVLGAEGYVAWRVTVPESELSPETLQVFERNVTLNLMNDDHALVYMIPGPNGSLDSGNRLVNFLWYTNEDVTSHNHIMTDKDGRLQRGHLLSGPHREVLNAISRPFIQSITDFVAPRAVLHGGKVLLVGDALALYRPHTASSTNQVGYQCLALEKYLRGHSTIEEWENDVLQFAHLHHARSVWYGENYQHPIGQAWKSALRYWAAAAADCWRVRFDWGLSKLRW